MRLKVKCVHKKGEYKMTEINAFYEEFFTGDIKYNKLMSNILAVIYEGLFIICMIMPYQEFRSNLLMIPIMAQLAGAVCYIQPYYSYMENKKRVKLFEKLKYTPMKVEEFKKYIIKKMVKFLAKITVVSLILQLVFATVLGGITVGNIIFPICMGFVLPFVLMLPIIIWQR